MTATAALAQLELAGVTAWVDGDQLRLRGRKPPEELLAEVRQHRGEIIHLLTRPDPTELEERAAIVADAHGGYGQPLPADIHHQQVEALLDVARQRPPSWTGMEVSPSPGSYCGCCSRHTRSGGRFWRERVEPKGWCCWTCHPPEHLAPEAVVIINTNDGETR